MPGHKVFAGILFCSTLSAVTAIASLPATQPADCAAPTSQPAAAANAGAVELVDVDRFDALRADKDHIVLDVRTPKEYESGHLANAINMPVTDKAAFDEAASKLDKSKTYLVHCKSGKRSAMAVQRLQAMGFGNLYDLKGGITAWTAANKPTETGAGPTTKPA